MSFDNLTFDTFNEHNKMLSKYMYFSDLFYEQILEYQCGERVDWGRGNIINKIGWAIDL